MQRYFAVVEKDQNSAYGATFPDVPGCFSAADTEDELLANAIEALSLHLEDMEPPEARSVFAIAKDKEVQRALAEGAFLLSVPLIHNDQRQVRVNVSMDKGTIDAIDTEAKLRKMTRSAFLAQAALKEIRNK